MNDKIKNFIHAHYIVIPICIVVIIACGIWFYSDRTSNIDTTGIRNATRELDNARSDNRQSIEYNQRIGNTVERSQVINERIEQTIDGSINANRRTTEAIDRSTELVKAARTDAANAKNLIRESRDILRTAEERNQKSESTTTKQ